MPVRSTPCLRFLGSLLLVYAAAAVGALASVDAAMYYARLSQPAWAPPPWLFGPVWSVLYTLMGVSLWLMWESRQRTKFATGLFVLQLAVNGFWSWTFFRWHEGLLAFTTITVLIALVTATLATFWTIRKVAALLLVPYLAWTGFAGLLCWTLWQANHGVLG